MYLLLKHTQVTLPNRKKLVASELSGRETSHETEITNLLNVEDYHLET
jgi:hypothetical protein